MDESSYSHCPNCLAEYRPGFDACHDCGIALVHGPAPVTEEHAPEHTKGHRHGTEDRNEVPVVLCRVPPLDADILVGKLRSEGLVTSSDGSFSALAHLYLPETRLVRVWVLESQLEKARKIAQRALSGDDAI